MQGRAMLINTHASMCSFLAVDEDHACIVFVDCYSTPQHYCMLRMLYVIKSVSRPCCQSLYGL